MPDAPAPNGATAVSSPPPTALAFHWPALYGAAMHLLGVFLAATFLGYAIAFLLLHGFDLRAMTVLESSTPHLSRVKAAMEEAHRVGISEATVLFMNNFSVSMMGVAFLLFTRLLDPNRVDRFPALLRRLLQKDAAMAGRIPLPLPDYRNIPAPHLKEVYGFLRVLPNLVASVNGMVLGLVCCAAGTMGGRVRDVLWPFVAVLPHGVLEIPGLLLGHAVPLAAYAAVKDKMAAGASTDVYEALRTFCAAPFLLRVIGVFSGLLAAAAAIEAYATAPLCDWLLTVWR